MERKKTLGIRILTSFGAEAKKDRFFVSFVVDEGVNSKTFISNREIKEGLNSLNAIFPGRQFGRIKYEVNEKTRTATMITYFPLEISIETFMGKNIASLLENRARFFLRKEYPWIETIKEWLPNPDRMKQKERRGRKLTETMDEARTALRRSIGKKRIQLRKTRPK